MDTFDHFNFDAWAALARNDPNEFERRRAAVLEEMVRSGTTNPRRLRGCLFRLEMERRRNPNPADACHRAAELMEEAVHRLRRMAREAADAVHPRHQPPAHGAGDPAAEWPPHAPKPDDPLRVIPFPFKRSERS